MSSLLADVRHAARGLLAQPAFTVAAVLTLGLGIGATTTIYGIVDGIVLRPLAFPNADRLITICEQYPGATRDWCSISPPNVEDISARSRAIEAIGIGREWSYHLATLDGAEAISGGIVTPGLFAALGARAELGRLFERSDLLGRESAVAVVSHEMWRRRFGGARDAVGRIIVLDGKPVTIVGVMSAGFRLPKFGDIEIWRPVHIDPSDEANREWRGFVAYGRLRKGTSLASARAELAGIAQQLRGEHFTSTRGWNLQEESLQDLVVGGTKPVLLLFLAAVSCVLLIGCANVANLLLARAASRAREMALRAALGATRARLVRGLLVESLVLALAGTVLGVLLALWGTRAFQSLAPPATPRLEDVHVDARVLAFALALSCATTLLFGLLPAIRAAGADVGRALREGGRSTTDGPGILGRALLVVELALALVLVSGSGLLMRSFAARTAWNPGFERDHLLTFTLFLPVDSYRGNERVAQAWSRVETELRTLPGVQAVGTASGGPLFGGDGADQVAFRTGGETQRRPALWYDAGPSFFGALGVPIVRGRGFDAADRLGAPPVVLVNETLAREFWPNDSPMDKQLAMFSGQQVVRVVGVLRDVPPATPGEPVQPQIYLSNRQSPRPFTYVVVRTSIEPSAVAADIRTRLRAFDPNVRPSTMRTMTERMQMELRTPRFQMVLVVAFGVAALALAAIGTYGLFAYRVSRRTREIGIRLALGAGRRGVVAAIVREGLALSGIGAAIGIVCSLVVAQAMRSMAAGVSPFDAVTFAGSVLTLLLVVVAACWGPARRAASVDPAIALTAE